MAERATAREFVRKAAPECLTPLLVSTSDCVSASPTPCSDRLSSCSSHPGCPGPARMSKSMSNRSIEQNIMNWDSDIDNAKRTTLASPAAVQPSISFSTANIKQILTPGREMWRSGRPAKFSLPPTSKNNCGFEAIALALLRLPQERGVAQRLGEIGKALAVSSDHEGLDERERGELHELASEVLGDAELKVLRELVTSALLETASNLEDGPTVEPASRGLVRSLLADASTPTGARFARLLRLLRLAAAAAVYMHPSGSTQASAHGTKSAVYMHPSGSTHAVPSRFWAPGVVCASGALDSRTHRLTLRTGPLSPIELSSEVLGEAELEAPPLDLRPPPRTQGRRSRLWPRW